jgi:hypothetical protein
LPQGNGCWSTWNMTAITAETNRTNINYQHQHQHHISSHLTSSHHPSHPTKQGRWTLWRGAQSAAAHSRLFEFVKKVPCIGYHANPSRSPLWPTLTTREAPGRRGEGLRGTLRVRLVCQAESAAGGWVDGVHKLTGSQTYRLTDTHPPERVREMHGIQKGVYVH